QRSAPEVGRPMARAELALCRAVRSRRRDDRAPRRMGRRLVTSDGEVRQLHHQLLKRWNERYAAGYAELFAIDCSLVGFDGTGVETRDEIRAHLEGIFADHRPARYVSIVREVRELGPQTALLRAVAGMV